MRRNSGKFCERKFIIQNDFLISNIVNEIKFPGIM